VHQGPGFFNKRVKAMTRQRFDKSSEAGFTLFYMAVFSVMLLLFVGLAVDSGRAYVVKAQLSKAVDGAALGAARMLNSGDPRGEAERLFKQNFPAGYLGTSSVTDPTADPGFFSLTTVPETGVNVVTVSARAILPTTFMRLGSLDEVAVTSSAEAQRRMVDLCLVLDVSSSIGSRWPAVRDAARIFVSAFDEDNDRLCLVFYGNGGYVVDQMPASRGYDKDELVSDIPNSLPGGSTAMVEGLFRGWDELRTVPAGQQSGLRVLVLFTDGASNSVPGNFPPTAGARGLRTWDFPKNLPDPDNQTHNSPQINGLYQTDTGASSPGIPALTLPWNSTTTHMQAPWLPLTSWHTHSRSAGIPTSFPLQTASLTVNGVAQSTRRGLRHWNAAAGRFPAQIFNINNAARNLVEIIANEAREDDDGDYPIRIYTIGMGELVRYNLGTIPEKPEEILMRMANDIRSPDYNDDQLEGKFYFAQTDADVGPAFQALQNQIIRLSK
jgi:Flp pilus assembly protein TadG